MNPERLEHELCLLKDKPVVAIVPWFGHTSFSYAGILTVIQSVDHAVGFHLVNEAGIAIIFFVEDVLALDPPNKVCHSFVIRLKGPHDYQDHYLYAH